MHITVILAFKVILNKVLYNIIIHIKNSIDILINLDYFEIENRHFLQTGDNFVSLWAFDASYSSIFLCVHPHTPLNPPVDSMYRCVTLLRGHLDHHYMKDSMYRCVTLPRGHLDHHYMKAFNWLITMLFIRKSFNNFQRPDVRTILIGLNIFKNLLHFVMKKKNNL
jgi:hypothetical protein